MWPSGGPRDRGDTRETWGGPEKLNGDDQEVAASPDLDIGIEMFRSKPGPNVKTNNVTLRQNPNPTKL